MPSQNQNEGLPIAAPPLGEPQSPFLDKELFAYPDRFAKASSAPSSIGFDPVTPFLAALLSLIQID
jgi:hypothetical protein